jgi:spore coat polysaccharide biosynthesis protein SpsF
MRSTSLVLIGIQARTNSTRLPGKINLELEGKTILQHVIDACDHAAEFLNRNHEKTGVLAKVAVLAPFKDPLIQRYRDRTMVKHYDIPEWDCLTRYVRAAQDYRADYVVRITADCVFTKSYLISRCVKAATRFGYDYTSNVLIRTFMEGLDVEVVSKPFLENLDQWSYPSAEIREHVTTLASKCGVDPYTVCHILDDIDMSGIKTSIDTMEDYERAVAIMRQTREKREAATLHGAYRG